MEIELPVNESFSSPCRILQSPFCFDLLGSAGTQNGLTQFFHQRAVRDELVPRIGDSGPEAPVKFSAKVSNCFLVFCH